MADQTAMMTEYYKILHHLQEFKLDREYPYHFKDTNHVKPEHDVDLVESPGSVHEKMLTFTDLTPSPFVNIVIPTLIRDYFSTDTVEIKLKPDVDLNPSNVTLTFHDNLNADAALLSCTGEGDTIPTNTVGKLVFTVNEHGSDPASYKLSGVASISLLFSDSLNSFDLLDVVFRCNEPVCTLEDLGRSLVDGEDYIRAGYGEYGDVDTVPLLLMNYKYMAAAAMVWLSKWEHEGHVMGDGTRDSKNYADRLLRIVDRAITSYKPGDDDEDGFLDVNEDLIGYSTL